MSERNHTPGPWHVAGGCQIRSDRDQIAKVWMMRGGEGKANARLIAAAPELLEALKELVKANEDHNESVSKVIGEPLGWKDSYLDKARSAIAKALGEE